MLVPGSVTTGGDVNCACFRNGSEDRDFNEVAGVGGVAERCIRIERDDGFDRETPAAPTGLGERSGDAFDAERRGA